MPNYVITYFQGNIHSMENHRRCLVRDTHRLPYSGIRMENTHIKHVSSLNTINYQNYQRKLYATSTVHFAFDAVPDSSSQSDTDNTTPAIIISTSTQDPSKMYNNRGMATYMDTDLQAIAICKTANDLE
jgi:hypothetical protein